MHTRTQTVEQTAIDTVRFSSVDAVQKANSGHPGMPMGAAPMGHVLWADAMNYNPQNSNWANRDRLILSARHGCMLHYTFLILTGYELTIDDLKIFRQLHSKTAGHPAYGLCPGSEVTTGPLGQGFANGVGFAIVQKQRLAVEAASSLGWHKYVTYDSDVMGIDRFGESAPGEEVMKEYCFTVENIIRRAKVMFS